MGFFTRDKREAAKPSSYGQPAGDPPVDPAAAPVDPATPVDPAAAAPAQPSYVTLDQLNAFKTDFMQGVQALVSQAAPGSQTQQQQQQYREPEIDDVSDDDFNNAVENGGAGAARVIAKRMKADQERLRRELIGQHIAPLQQQGTAVLSGLVKRQTEAQPYYKLLKREVDAAIAALPEHLQMQPEAQMACYNMTVGQNMDRIIQANNEETARQAQLKAAQPQDTGGRGAGREKDRKAEGDMPTPEDVFGQAGLAALANKGRTAEQEVQRQGYKDWNDYVERAVKPYH